MKTSLLVLWLSFICYADDCNYYSIECWNDALEGFTTVQTKIQGYEKAKKILETKYKDRDCRIVEY